MGVSTGATLLGLAGMLVAGLRTNPSRAVPLLDEELLIGLFAVPGVGELELTGRPVSVSYLLPLISMVCFESPKDFPYSYTES